MNMRLPIVAAVVAAAAGVAAFRGLHQAAPAPTLSFGTPAGEAADPPAIRRPALRERAAHIVVYVAGEVRRGGVYELPPSARASDALRAAGGATAGADLVAVNLAQPLNDGDEVAVPAIGASDGPAANTPHRHGSPRSHHRKKRHRKHHRQAAQVSDASEGPASVVDLNSADEAELEMLPGIGPALAERIVTFREQTGQYGSSDDLLDVAGMTPNKLDAIAPYVSVGS